MANKIRVDTSDLERWSSKLAEVSEALTEAAEALGRVDTDDDWWRKVRVKESFRLRDEGGSVSLSSARSAVSQLERTLERYQQRVNKLSNAVKKAGVDFTNTESDVKSLINGTSDGAVVDIYGVGKGSVVNAVISQVSSWYDQFKENIEGAFDYSVNFLSDRWDDFKTGVSMLVNDYKNHGTTYKILETGKAVVNIALNSVAIYATWFGSAAVTTFTGGLGAATIPLAVVATTYNTNSIANSIADIYNCWGGDVEQVGEVNFLKQGMEAAGGGIGSLFGQQEAGEKIGSAVYTGGEIASIISNISNLKSRITQASDITGSTLSGAGSEVKQGLKGLWDIAANTDVRDIPYNLKMLEYSVPHIKEVFNAAGLIKEAGKTAYDVGKKGISILSDMMDACFSVAY